MVSYPFPQPTRQAPRPTVASLSAALSSGQSQRLMTHQRTVLLLLAACTGSTGSKALGPCISSNKNNSNPNTCHVVIRAVLKGNG
jgi:hypothetical protein